MTDLVTGLDRDGERKAQIRLIDAIAEEYAKAFGAEIGRMSDDLLTTFEATGSVPFLPPEHVSRIEGIYRDLSLTSTRAFGSRILDQGKAAGLLEHKDLAGFAEFFARVALEFIAAEGVRRRITSVAETTRNQITGQIAAGQREGLGVSQIGSLIRGRIPSMSRMRANLIARTETHAAANHGADAAARHTGLDMAKEWISVEDHRTRDFGQGDGVVDEYDHRSMNGQRVDMDQPFLMPWRGGEPIRCMFPGDTSLPAGASINCRCAVGHIVKGLL